MIKRLNDNLDKYQKQMSELNDGEKMLASLANSIRELVSKCIANANSTDSIDERINALVTGLQSVLKEVNGRQENFLKNQAVLEIKINTLEDVLLECFEETKVLDTGQ